MTTDSEEIRAYFDREDVLEHYARATANLGLWRSEEVVFRRLFQAQDRLLEVGCGTGRIALGLHELGYQHLLGVDLSRSMIKRARLLATLLEYQVSFQVGDATRLIFEDGLFDGAIFGFNGLMQIPARTARQTALREILRVVRPGGYFAFTSHDRDHYTSRSYWTAEAERWRTGAQNPALAEFGDRIVESDIGRHFIHVPSRPEVLEDLASAGWEWIEDAMRSEIANEPQDVREFADECRFWIVRRPE